MPGDTDQGLLFIEGELTIYRAAELKDALLAAVNHSPVLEVDLAGVTDIDTAGVQLLMLAKRSALQLQRQVRRRRTARRCSKSSSCWTWAPGLAIRC